MSEEMKAKCKLLLSANKNGYDRLEGAALEQPLLRRRRTVGPLRGIPVRVAAAFAPVVAEKVPAHAHQPVRKRGDVLRQGEIRADERLLHQILGQMPVAAQSEQIEQRGLIIPLVELCQHVSVHAIPSSLSL